MALYAASVVVLAAAWGGAVALLSLPLWVAALGGLLLGYAYALWGMRKIGLWE